MTETGEQPRAGGRAAVLGARRAGGHSAALGHQLNAAREWLFNSLRAEADAARLAPWLPVGFGVGILLYFAAPAEPSLAASAMAAVVASVIARASRERPFGFALALLIAAIAGGFLAASLRAATVAHPVLTRPTTTVTLSGFVETRDATERSDRIVLRVTAVQAGRALSEPLPQRVRLAMHRGSAPSVGEHVELRARLRPLLGPLRPGGYDYARGAYFAGIGATGFLLGKPKAMPAPTPLPWDIRAYAAIEGLRWSLTNRIRNVLPGETGAVAAALVTGIRDAIPPEVNEAMRVSGLYHVLSISGLHMALVAGTLFGVIRGGLALVPSLALRRPIKKWAAIGALAGTAFYLVLSGAEVATQRSFIMIAIVLTGVLIDRPAITVRTLSAAAFGVVALQPEALLNPSFQMSFAATLALVALFERFAPLLAEAPTAGGAIARLAERSLRWLLLAAAASLVAGLATTVYVAFHFHRVAPYGVIANVLAMPVISFLVMPAGLVSVLLLPFGYDAHVWKLMGAGLDAVLLIAWNIAALPGAEGRVPAFEAGAVLIASLGLLTLALPAGRVRWLGVPMLVVAIWLAATAPRPDVLVDADADIVAVRGTDGRLTILDARRDRLSAQSWLAAEADGRRIDDELAAGFRCDADGCVARTADGAIIAVARRSEALVDDCSRAALVISRLTIPPACGTAVIDSATLATTGAIALRRVGGKWVAEPARSPLSDRPWYGRRVAPDTEALARLHGRRRMQAPVRTEESPALPGDVPVPEDDP